jgi:hypothetical protein
VGVAAWADRARVAVARKAEPRFKVLGVFMCRDS